MLHTRKEAKKQHAHGWKVKANGGPHSAGDGAYDGAYLGSKRIESDGLSLVFLAPYLGRIAVDGADSLRVGPLASSSHSLDT